MQKAHWLICEARKRKRCENPQAMPGAHRIRRELIKLQNFLIGNRCDLAKIDFAAHVESLLKKGVSAHAESKSPEEKRRERVIF